ncbi:HTH domain-containing protein [Arthrobacter ulcerisalmonis]|uniref:HTH domain-containing protein n=1 Tax=Arthrobacter ulcerisalmonis TaxID=2483813 RepID=UPI003672D131
MLGVNALRTSILRYLAQHPEGATSGEIGRDLNVDYRTVWRYLKEIETQVV